MPQPPKNRRPVSSKCIDPPRPWATPVSLPNSSAITAAGSEPTARAVP